VLARWTCWFEAILGAVMGGEGWCGEMDGERGSEGAIGLRSHEDVVAHGRDETEAGCQGREDGAEVEIVYGLWMCIVIEIPDPARNNVDQPTEQVCGLLHLSFIFRLQSQHSTGTSRHRKERVRAVRKL
jgi:hypothetical protein